MLRQSLPWAGSPTVRFLAATLTVAAVSAVGLALAFLLFAAPGRGAGPSVPFRIVLTNNAYTTLAVDHRGVAYGTAISGTTALYRLYSSTDEGQTWTPVADFPSCSRVTDISVLSDDTLLAHVNNCSNVTIYRSADHGTTWTAAFTFPQPVDYRTLTPHSITDDGRSVYIGSYNTLDDSAHENWVWRSDDDGQTWQVVMDTTTHRHIHFVQADPTTHWVYVGFGDAGVAEIDVTKDQGATWSPLCTGDQCLAVDMAFDPSGFALFGQDVPYGTSNIQRVDLATGAVSTIMRLPGISYSSMRLRDGVWLIGTTHGVGTAYVPGDLDVHLFASIDGGQTFTDVYDTPYTDPNSYALKVQFAYPNGDFPIQATGGPTVVAHIDNPTSTSPPANTSLPVISGTAQQGQLLSGSDGGWSNSPTSYGYQWLRCDSSGAACVAIPAATGNSYTPAAADVGATLRFQVTATNGAGPASATSTQTAVVVAGSSGGSAGTLGNTVAGSVTVRPSSNYKFGSVFALSQSATTVDFKFYVAGGTVAQKFTPVIYNVDGSGTPTTLVTSGAEVTVAAGQAAGWATSTLPAVALVPGSYMLALLSGPTDSGAILYYAAVSDTKAGQYNANAYPTPSPSWGTTQFENHLNSFYIDYTTTGTTGPPPANTSLPVISGSAQQGQAVVGQ